MPDRIMHAMIGTYYPGEGGDRPSPGQIEYVCACGYVFDSTDDEAILDEFEEHVEDAKEK